MSNHRKPADLITHIANLEEEATLATVRQRLAAGHNPLHIIEEAQQGMRLVGERYEQGEYYIAGLIMAGEIFREVLELTQPEVEDQLQGEVSGTVLIGTVQGDIHDLGKNIMALLLRCHGFDVHDLGVDVPPEQFVAQTVALRPDIIGLSCLLTTAYPALRETIKLLRDKIQTWNQPPSIIIGGNQLNDQVCEYVGADAWCNEAKVGLTFCQKVVQI